VANLAPGDEAPAFRLTDQSGGEVGVDDYRGRNVVVFFYPKADTSGCTAQACALRDAEPDLSGLGAAVIGISPDPMAAQRKWADKHGLPFPLLADTDHAVADAYGVWGPKKLYGREYEGIKRSAFVIDDDGRVAAAFYGISPKDTVPKVTQALQVLQG
jgi:peroxiredoxin Q/BCP